jgi:hypothetical protein
VTAVLADWIATSAGGSDLGPPQEIAATMVAALHGLKRSGGGLEAYRSGQARLARMFARALGLPDRTAGPGQPKNR